MTKIDEKVNLLRNCMAKTANILQHSPKMPSREMLGEYRIKQILKPFKYPFKFSLLNWLKMQAQCFHTCSRMNLLNIQTIHLR